MTTLELRSTSTLREQVRVLRRMRRDGIAFAARQSLVGGETGEFVEAVPLGNARWLVAVGDAKGRGPQGLEAARAVARHVVERAPATRHLSDLLVTANDVVVDATDGDELVSLLLVVLDGAHRTIRLANAGQIPPLAVGRAGGVVVLEGHGPALGLLADATYHEAGPLRLAPGMVVLAVTDGVHEAACGEGHAFGRDRTSRALATAREAGPRSVVRRVLADVAAHATPVEADDRTAVAFGFVAE